MSRSVPLARRNLASQRARLVMSVGGVGLALLLVLALNAMMAGIERQVSAYTDHSGADAIVSQRDVTTMHMSNSSLPLTTLERARSLPEAASVAPILYRSVVLATPKGQAYTYLIGFHSLGRSSPCGWGLIGRDSALCAGIAAIFRLCCVVTTSVRWVV
jgi:putative ABC transport system permease protein